MEHKSVFAQIKPVFTFSLSEVLAAIFLLEGLVFGMTIAALNKDGYLQQSFFDFANSSSAYSQYQIISDQINSNQYVANFVVFTIWAITGLLLFNTILIVRYSEKSIADLIQMLTNGGAAMHEAFEEKVVQMTIRIVALILLLVLIVAFTVVILPFLVVLLDTSRLHEVKDYILATAGVWLVAVLVGHFLIVLLRCLTLRRRLIFTP